MERNLLLVDDEKNILSSLRRTLRREGINITCAYSAQEGMEALSKEEFGVIISDQRMPDTTGTEFLSEVKTTHPDTVRIILSGYSDLSAVLEAINKGAIYKFITKPWEDDHLKELITEAFTQYELRKENERLNQQLRQVNDKLNNINKELEHRVDIKTKQLQMNIKALEISHEILENLPTAVIGIDNDNNIVLANNKAHQTFTKNRSHMIGRKANKVLPEKLHNLPSRLQSNSFIDEECAVNNKPGRVYASRLKENLQAEGFVIVFTET